MNEYLDASKDNLNEEEFDLEKKLRPLSFDDFTGQEQVIENLKIFVEAANQREEALDHTLLHKPDSDASHQRSEPATVLPKCNRGGPRGEAPPQRAYAPGRPVPSLQAGPARERPEGRRAAV